MISVYNHLRKDKRISVEENKRKFVIDNKDLLLVNHVEVDGHLIKTGYRCDHLFEIECLTKVFYVELKGSDIKHALEQLEATIKFCKKFHDDFLKECFIVCSRVPKETTSTQVLKVKLSKCGIKLKISSNELVVNL
jgi:hypothetical protein